MIKFNKSVTYLQDKHKNVKGVDMYLLHGNLAPFPVDEVFARYFES